MCFFFQHSLVSLRPVEKEKEAHKKMEDQMEKKREKEEGRPLPTCRRAPNRILFSVLLFFSAFCCCCCCCCCCRPCVFFLFDCSVSLLFVELLTPLFYCVSVSVRSFIGFYWVLLGFTEFLFSVTRLYSLFFDSDLKN